jgi:hypothetical protein
MFIILASELDAVAHDVAARWPGGLAKLMTPRDLCTEGWRIHLEAFEESYCVVDGTAYPISCVQGVLTLLPYVRENELFTIEDTERRYVGSEVSAFLYYFLSRIRCPVLNRPTAHCLTGPSWRAAQWIFALHQAGIISGTTTIAPQFSSSVNGQPGSHMHVSIVGGRRLGEADPVCLAGISRLARLANVDFLSVRMDGDADRRSVTSIELIPDLRDREILTAIHSHFMG